MSDIAAFARRSCSQCNAPKPIKGGKVRAGKFTCLDCIELNASKPAPWEEPGFRFVIPDFPPGYFGRPMTKTERIARGGFKVSQWQSQDRTNAAAAGDTRRKGTIAGMGKK